MYKKYQYKNVINLYSELLSKSLLLTKYADALKSIKLQEDHHRRQIAIIQDKQARLAKEIQMSRNINMMADDFPSEGDRVESGDRSNNISQYAYQTLDQLDTMLQNFSFGAPSASSEMSASDVNYATRATKMHKSDETVIEELKLTIESLREHFRELSHESDSLRKELKQERAEKERLKEVNTELSRKLAAYKGVPCISTTDHKKYTSSLDVNFFSLDLPPLETPNFDFELFKSPKRGDGQVPL